MFGFAKKPDLIVRSNINCGGCIKGVTPTLDSHPQVKKWKVDTENPEKLLSIWGTISFEELHKSISEAGFEVSKN